MKIRAVILSCLDSARLPGKVLLEVDGRALLGYVLAFFRNIGAIETRALATSDRAVEYVLSNFAKMNEITRIRGAIDDVAERFSGARETLNLDAAIRINGDK